MPVSSPPVSEEYLQELAERGEAVYNRLKASLEPEFNGQHIAIHVDTGDYAIAKFSTLAARELSRQHPVDGRIYSRLVGSGPDTDFVARHAAFDALAGQRICRSPMGGLSHALPTSLIWIGTKNSGRQKLWFWKTHLCSARFCWI